MATSGGFSVGVSGERFPDGLHLCHIFNDDAERERTTAQYLAWGIGEGERALCAFEAMSPERVRELLVGLGVDVGPDRLQLIPAEAAYCPGGAFRDDEVLRGFRSVCDHSVACGFHGTRIAGDMRWAARNGTTIDQLLTYEAKVNGLVGPARSTAMCEYDARLFDGAAILDLLAVHPAMILRGQIIHNPFYVDPTEYLARRRERTRKHS